jgi:hypothetical protein
MEKVMSGSRVLTGVLGIVLAASQAAMSAAATPAPESRPESAAATSVASPLRVQLQQVREVSTHELGVTRPRALAWNDQLGALLLSGGRRLLRVAPETREGAARLPATPGVGTLAVRRSDGRTSYVAGAGLLSMSRARVASQRPAPQRTAQPFGAGLDGLAYDASGRLVGLRDAALLRYAGGRVVRTPLQGLSGHDLRGLSAWPGSRLLYAFDRDTRRVVGLDSSGAVVQELDASSLELHTVTGLAVAPSADATDSPSIQHVYLADAGDAGDATVRGRVVETSLASPTAVAEAAALTATTGTLVRTVDTSAFSPPSPDPSGVAYLPGADRLFIADGEVDEMSIFQGKNLFATTRSGSVVDTGVSQPWSNEPVGVGYNPGNNHLFVSDDDQKEVFELVAGGDGRFGTADDTITHFDTNTHGNTDPEGIDYDTAVPAIWSADGVNTQVFRYRAGTDGKVGTSDDVRSNFDVGVYGARDPEGMAYDSVRDTILIVDDGSETIYEFDKSGGLLNTISIAGHSIDAAAGLAVAPGSSSPTQRNYYVVARGLDNDSHPTENDGKLYEFSATLPPVGTTNQPPLVNAGPDQSIVLPASAALDGTVSDDGRPNPPATVTTTWEKVSGFGTVTFGNPNAVDTTATFSVEGTYVLRLSASDSQATAADEITVLVRPAGSGQAVEVPVSAGADDAEQTTSGFVGLTSADLELVTDGSTVQTVGTRFAGVGVPAGATITQAWIQFRTDEVSTGAAPLNIRAESADNPAPYQAVNGNVTARSVTSQSVVWSPPDWTTVGERGPAQRTADISSLVQQLVTRPGWLSGNAMAFQFTGSGRRTAFAFEGGAPSAPLLHVEYTTGTPPPPGNDAPVVNAGPDHAVVLPNELVLDGTVTDDGKPAPPATVTTSWSKVTGPGTVTFANPASVDTTATFDAAGSYVLRLSATDSALSSTDDVTVTVTETAPPDGTLNVPVAAGSDDAEQAASGATALTSSDLELVTAGSTVQTVGTRFAGLQVPPGATITQAWVQFRTDEVSTDVATLTIRAEAADNAATYQNVSGNITSRAVTGSVSWSPPAWNLVGEQAAAQRTPNLASLVQAVVSRPGWAQGNALALQFSGSGRRTAEAFEGGFAPSLHVEYTTGGPPVNLPPSVNAGPDQQVFLPGSATLDATVTDDGKPAPPAAVTTSWSKVSGPGTVTFGDPGSVDTSAAFGADGTYVLRLTAMDGELTSSDELTVTVQPAGSDQVLDVSIRLGADDAEERYNGTVLLTSTDLDMTADGSRFMRAVGLRFTGVNLPQGAVITNAYVQFAADETGSGAAALTIRGQAADNAPAFTTASSNLSSRATTTASVGWAPPDWLTVGAATAAQRTSDLSPILQEIVGRQGWTSGNALALLVTGTAARFAESFEGSTDPRLHVEWHPAP